MEASAVNGLGNMYLMSGEYEQAIANCRRATQLMPEYANAWADLFLAYSGQAESGQADLDAMREVLHHLKATAQGDALLEPILPEYQRMFDDAVATRRASPVRPSPPPAAKPARAKPRRP